MVFDHFQALKKSAQTDDVPAVPVSFLKKDNFTWNLQRMGTKQYGFVLRSGDVTVQLSSRSHDTNYPNCRIEIGSISCQDEGFRIYDRLIKWLNLNGFIRKKELVSRVDFAVDCVGTDIDGLGASLRERWITKAKKFVVHYEGVSLTGIMLGKGDICLRVYDKRRELTKNKVKRDFFLSLWKCDEETPVTRVEFQFRRPVLKDLLVPINNVRDLEKNADSLWQFASKQWARLTRRSVDRKNRNYHLEMLSSLWRKIQSVVFLFPAVVNSRVKKPLTKNLIALREQARGCILNLAAAAGHDQDDFFGILKTCSDAITSDMADFMTDRYSDFAKLFEVRRNQCFVGF